MRRTFWLTLLVVLTLAGSHVAADTYTLIVCGSGGEPAYEETFTDWGIRLRQALIASCDHDPDHIVLLTESGDQPEATAATSRESILSRLRELGVRTAPTDQLLVVLIGHGSYRNRQAKLIVPGPDLTAEDLDATLQMSKARRTIVLNTASVSAPFLNTLAKEGRIIITSTRSHEQVDATQYAEHWIAALEDGSADRNRDERISVWEVAEQAALLTARAYSGKKQVASENAILDDNGDGKGTRLHTEEGAKVSSPDGSLARRTYLKDVTFPEEIPKEWVTAYQQAIERVEAWIAEKELVDSATYVKRLEELLLDAAKKNEKIRNVKM